MALNPTSIAAPSSPIRAAFVGATHTSPLYSGGSIWVLKHDLAVGDIYTELVGVRSNHLPRWESARITSVDNLTGVMQITYGLEESKMVKLRDLPVTGGAKIESLTTCKQLVAYRGGRWVWVGKEVKV